MNVSVVIPSYNAQDNLVGTLDALERQEFSGTLEVVVTDCSDTNAVKQLCAKYGFVKYHYENERFNPGKGRNIGAEIADGDLLVFVDSDVVLQKDAIEQAWSFFQSGKEIFGGALELNEQTAKPTIASYIEHYYFNSESQMHRPVCERPNLSSALMVFKRSIFIEVGGFKDIPRMQDTELTERLRRAEHKLYFCPRVVGLQIQDSPLNKVFRKIFIVGKNMYFIRYQGSNKLKKVALFILLPLITTLKIARIVVRHSVYNDWRRRLIALALSPLLLIAGSYWMFGLYRSMIFGGEISKKRD